MAGKEEFSSGLYPLGEQKAKQKKEDFSYFYNRPCQNHHHVEINRLLCLWYPKESMPERDRAQVSVWCEWINPKGWRSKGSMYSVTWTKFPPFWTKLMWKEKLCPLSLFQRICVTIQGKEEQNSACKVVVADKDVWGKLTLAGLPDLR